MADLGEITEAVKAAQDGGCTEVALLYCVSGCQAPAADCNLKTLADMATHFGVPVCGVEYGRKSDEVANVKSRRFLYFVKDIKAGDAITKDCARSVRPGYGLAPKHLNQVIGRSRAAGVEANTAVTEGHLA
ncbi:NeuB family protein [Sulfitobacter litoralis]|uniref:NeuB family protein n=1 Tax=Sulfitobacter litoralis TaxID=335975 RepID=A0ABY0SUG2_9RHOB|nr:N-acetylneuraminate synthase family protein [Sulfitobacter litoralis]SDP62205.1 NeuB family protein [Sulfitobacter litoralis]